MVSSQRECPPRVSNHKSNLTRVDDRQLDKNSGFKRPSNLILGGPRPSESNLITFIKIPKK